MKGPGWPRRRNTLSQGTLVHTEFLPGGKKATTLEEEFSVCVLGPKWIIAESGQRSGQPWHKEAAFDGTNTYQLMKFAPPPLTQGKRAPILINASITCLGMPTPDPAFATTPIWLAYRS